MSFEFTSFSGQTKPEVEAAMTEERVERCIGCPYAMRIAAELAVYSSRGGVILDMIADYGSPDATIDYHLAENDRTTEQKRQELGDLTANCSGYTGKVPGRRPSMMCQSPTEPDTKIGIMGGWTVDIFTLRILKRLHRSR